MGKLLKWEYWDTYIYMQISDFSFSFGEPSESKPELMHEIYRGENLGREYGETEIGTTGYLI